MHCFVCKRAFASVKECRAVLEILEDVKQAKVAAGIARECYQIKHTNQVLPPTTATRPPMASTSPTPVATSSSGKLSRIPSLGKAFNKFRNKDKDAKPPPPPPKDLHYSPRVLSPDTLSIPPISPISPYNFSKFPQSHSPGPSMSTLSLVSSSAASARSQTQENRQSRLRAKASSLFTFVKRSSAKVVKSPEPEPDCTSTDSQGDSGISTPWNFQHNIHVDEAFIGLPPSWSTQLEQHGFSPEEIAALQARRMNIYSGRPSSPNLRIHTAPPTMATPILGAPSPDGSGSLRRQYSDASSRSSCRDHGQPSSPPPVPPIVARSLTSSPSANSLRSTRTTTTKSSHALSSSLSGHQHSYSATLASRTETVDNQTTDHDQFIPDTSNEPERPSTPPRRPLHVVNPALTSSPPPAYSQFYTPDKKPPLGDEKVPHEEKDDASQATPSSHRQQPSTDSIKNPRSIIRNKRNSVLPPRLSLHQASDSLDLTSWSAELLSGISSSSFNSNASYGSTRSGPNRSKTPSTNMTSPLSLPSSSKSDPIRSPLSQQPILATHKRQGSKNPPRPIVLQEDNLDSKDKEDDDNMPPPPTGWAEPASATRMSPSAPTPPIRGPDAAFSLGAVTNFDDLIEQEAESKNPTSFSPALEDGNSPILPMSPKLNVLSPAELAAGWKTRTNSQHLPPTLPLPSLPPPPVPRENDRKLSTRKKEQEDGDDPNESFLHVEDVMDTTDTVRYSSRSSSSTMSTISTATVVGYGEHALVKNASVIRRTSAYVIDRSNLTGNKSPPLSPGVQRIKPPSSPMSSHFGSEDGSGSGSVSSGSPSQDRHPTPTETDSPLSYYIGASYTPSPSRMTFETKAPVHLLVSTSGTFGGVQEDEVIVDEEAPSEPETQEHAAENVTAAKTSGPGQQEELQRPRIVISLTEQPPLHTTSLEMLTPGGITPLTPIPRYRGWLSAVVKPLEDFIDEAIDPREYYIDLQEIAEGESGSVFAAQLVHNKDLSNLRMDAALVAQDQQTLASGEPVAVAIKSVAIVPSGSPKLLELEWELKLMRGLQHENILSMDALYVDLVEDSLWIRMELMERSLADVISLVEGGLQLHDRMIARFASDVVQALQFLQTHHIAHRDVRSDNLLLNIQGVVKLADFSTAVQVPPSAPLRPDIAGVAYWQAPEVRKPPYNALKVDVWSLGATIWELAEAEPPFARTQQLTDRYPELSNPKLFSPAFHDFLHLCSEPADSRPAPATLGSHAFMKNACGRNVIIQLLAQCMNIEKQQCQVEES